MTAVWCSMSRREVLVAGNAAAMTAALPQAAAALPLQGHFRECRGSP